MPEENMNQKFTLKTTDEIRNKLIEERNWNELMSTKDKKVFRVLSYIEYSIIVISIITGSLSMSAFASNEFCNRIKNLCNNCRN